MGSRFIECPICGQNVAMYLASVHTEGHFSTPDLPDVAPSGTREHAPSTGRGHESTIQIEESDDISVEHPGRVPSVEQPGQVPSDSQKCDSSYPGQCSQQETQKSAPGAAGDDRGDSSTTVIDDAAEESDHGTESFVPKKQKTGGGWSFLKNPTAKDVRGPRRTRKAFDLPPRPYDYLVVLDFEWTCDNRQRLEPLEIIEFPAVLVKTSFPPAIVSEFQVYCRPEKNPILTKFCKELTAITQEQVDAGVLLPKAIELHQQWLETNLPGGIGGGATFAMVTWSDADILGALHSELRRRGLQRPAHFDAWINLKALFKSHYKREPKGGLQRCVESCGLSFDGRAHSGLVDSINTAKICIQMISQGYSFSRTTRGFGPDGEAWGSAESRRQRAQREEEEKRGGRQDGAARGRHDSLVQPEPEQIRTGKG
mmetsp:Transcript_64032/g.150655  ORF Transcript_64032/g.150655 Transcript_64032/m.150655 type:complete len:426 (-) Transcript_64032:84-1361(-)